MEATDGDLDGDAGERKLSDLNAEAWRRIRPFPAAAVVQAV